MADSRVQISPTVTLVLRRTNVYEKPPTSLQSVEQALSTAKGNATLMAQLARALPASPSPRSEDAVLHDVATEVLHGGFVLRIQGAGCDDGKNKRSRFFEQLPQIYALADKLNVPRDYLVGLASYESGWLDDHNFALNNLWGLTQAGGNNIQFSGPAGNPQPSTDYWEKKVGPFVQGTTTVKDFFAGLKKEGYNSANPNYFNLDPRKGDLANRIANIGKWKAKCGFS